MRLRIQRFAVVGLASLVVSIASAQPEEAPAPSAELSAQQDVTLTPQQMLKQAEEHVARIDQAARGVRGQLSRARQERDVVKVLCLNDKLNQIDVALASAGDRLKTLQATVEGNASDRAKHEYTIIVVLRERVTALVAEANQCVGEELGYLGETDVTMDVDPNIADTDPAVYPEDPFLSDPPRLASPTG